ncbi:phosphatase PAP2 family protein [Longimicrobium sp.]|uniref:phosphatase PAP2 family protein n=1 Tax=Longimicrobium sp. TaxID=2029185 RepID=UPI002E362355|nr:phosphatase PAP2 family protein [Longimicrobium sp.]HEX6038475.1 phosphatase PAP2 family protein [Longimicrobium sp.]
MNTRSGPPLERRAEPRTGAANRLRSPMFGLLRLIGRNVRGFHAAVGIFLVAGLALVTLAAAVFALIASAVVRGQTQAFDDAILRFMGSHGAAWLDNVALEVTALGARVVVYMVVLVASAFLWQSRHHYSAALLWVAVLGSGLINTVLKVSFNRPRPDVFPWRTQHVGLASFPSGHAMTSIVVYGTLAFLIARLAPTPRLKRLTWALAILVILLVGLSRLYLGVHYPSDVLAGFVIGGAWAITCALGMEAVRYFRTRRPEVARDEKDLDAPVIGGD